MSKNLLSLLLSTIYYSPLNESAEVKKYFQCNKLNEIDTKTAKQIMITFERQKREII